MDIRTNPNKVYEAVKVSVTEWTELYDFALNNDPALAGEMMGNLDGKIGGELATGYIIGAGSAKVIQKVIELKKISKVANQILDYNRIGSGLKPDLGHRSASFLSFQQLKKGSIFKFKGGDGIERKLLQTEGYLNDSSGIFEYIVDPSGKITHQRFIKNGIINGLPNQVVPKVK